MTDEDAYSQAETRRAIDRIDAALKRFDEKLDRGLLAMAETLHESYLTRERYDADEQRRIEIRGNLTRQVDEQGNVIADIIAKNEVRERDRAKEHTARARERRAQWAGIIAAVVGALIAGIFAVYLATRAPGHPVTCIPINGTTQQTCTFH